MTELDDFDAFDKKPRNFKWVRIAERIFIGMAIVGLLFKIQHYPGHQLLLAVGLSMLSLLYFIRAFFPSRRQSTLSKVSAVFSNVGRAVLLVGVLFKMEHFPGASALLLVGLAVLSLGFVGGIFSS